jgi:hypothetical protein
MANLASFRINQAGNPVPEGSYETARRDILTYAIGGDVSFDAENSGLTYLWEIVQPPGSSGVIVGATQQTATFSAQYDGGYIIKLTVNPGSPNEDVSLLYFGIPTDVNGTDLCLPALNETTQDNSISHPEWGWWEKMYAFLRELASNSGSGGGDSFFESGSGTNSLQRIDFGSASGDYSWAFGLNSSASGDYSWAFGPLASATGDYAYSFGYNSAADGDGSFAFGNLITTMVGSSVFGYAYTNALPYSLAVGIGGSAYADFTNPQTLRVPVNGRTDSHGVTMRLYVDSGLSTEIGPVPACSYMNIALHLVAKSDTTYDTSPALVTFDGTIQALASSTGITYQDWIITKTSSTSVYEEELWEVSVPATSSDLTKLEINIVQDGLHGRPDVVWSGYLDIAYVATAPGGGGGE